MLVFIGHLVIGLVCLKIVGSEESQQCFEIEIKAAEELTGDIANNKKTINKNSVSFYIEKGTSPFRVVSNGRTIGTYSSRSFEAIIEKEGLSLGTSSGINIAGAIKLGKELGPGKTIITILCDKSDRYNSKLFNKSFLQEKGLPYPNWL